jgi:hypothetical protein
MQSSIVVDFVAAGDIDTPDGAKFVGHATGFWHLEFQDHAIARLIQRCRGCDVESVLWAAHGNALDIKFGPIVGQSIVLPAGPGAFIAELVGGNDLDTGERIVFLQARTWIADEMALGEPVVTSERGQRLGDGPLLPIVLRRLWSTPEAA